MRVHVSILFALICVLGSACSSSATVQFAAPANPNPTAVPATPTPQPEPTPAPTAIPATERGPTMLDQCQDGNDMACDLLYYLSDIGSPEEDIGATCAGRQPDLPDYCAPGIEADGYEGWIDLDSEALPGIIADCESRDWLACDYLYYFTPPGSAEEEIGYTCGGAVTRAIPDCQRMFSA